MEITLKSPWSDLETRETWLQWLEIARTTNPDGYDWWTTTDGCGKCVHFDREATWCQLVERPATRNPVLNMLGMACCGMGYDDGIEQLELNVSEYPF